MENNEVVKTKTNWLVTILACIITGLVVFLVMYFVVNTDKKTTPETNNNPTSTSNENNSNSASNENSNSNTTKTIADLAGEYEATVTKHSEELGEYYWYYKLTINSDGSCNYSRMVSGGSGFGSSGPCTLNNNSITLEYTEYMSDATTIEETGTHTFTLNKDNSLTYEDGTTLVKK